jgi:hypothetical protein
MNLQDIDQGTARMVQGTQGEFLEVVRMAYGEARRILAEGTLDAALLCGLVQGALVEVDRHAALVLERTVREGRRVGCRAGCAHCCHQHLLPSSVELALLALSIAEDERPGLLERARASAALVQDLSHAERYTRGVPCVLLEGRLCGVYEIRPSMCRSYFSLSKLACDKDWQARFRGSRRGVPLLSAPQLYSGGMVFGVELALHRAGLQVERAEMAAGLVAMLEDRGAERWLAGEPVLQNIRHMGLGGEGQPESDHVRSLRNVAAMARREGWW